MLLGTGTLPTVPGTPFPATGTQAQTPVTGNAVTGTPITPAAMSRYRAINAMAKANVKAVGDKVDAKVKDKVKEEEKKKKEMKNDWKKGANKRKAKDAAWDKKVEGWKKELEKEEAEASPLDSQPPQKTFIQNHYFVFFFGFALVINALGVISLPWLPGTSLYIVQTNFPDTINGTLNGLQIINLSHIRVSLARNTMTLNSVDFFFLSSVQLGIW